LGEPALTTVLEDSQTTTRYTVDGLVPRAVAIPATEAEIASLLQQASGAGDVVVPWGAGTKQDYGTPMSKADLVVSLERLNQVVEYVPADMTITVQAGMRFADVQALTAKHGQTIPLDPPRSAQATIGGVVATASSGPRRMAYGGVRDLVLGVRIALPDGRTIRAGGKVVKNVAGYDLTKLVIGSLGTLGIITEVSLRLRPLPVDTRTLLYGFPDTEKALSAAESILNSELLPAAVSLLTPEPARLLEAPGPLCLALALEESPENNAYQVQRISQMIQGQTGSSTITGEAEGSFWDRLTNFDQRFGAVCRFRVNGVISDLAKLLRGNAIAHVPSGSVLIYGFGGTDGIDGLPDRALLESGPVALRRQRGVWGAPQPEWKLAERIKQAFDPGRVLNRGRYVGGI
jgi:glycolate oxidase FAD binding subunit